MIIAFKNSLIIAILLLINVCVNASVNGNWTETFDLKGGNWVVHTPKNVSLNNTFFSGGCINIEGKTFNGIDISSCGLHICQDSTREQFVDKLTCSGLYPS